VYNLVCGSCKVTATAAGSFLGQHCAAVHVFRIYGVFGVRQSWRVRVSTERIHGSTMPTEERPLGSISDTFLRTLVHMRTTRRLSQKMATVRTASVTDLEVRVRFPALLYFLRSSGSGTGSTQPREYN
jgi:hypothetical protein